MIIAIHSCQLNMIMTSTKLMVALCFKEQLSLTLYALAKSTFVINWTKNLINISILYQITKWLI